MTREEAIEQAVRTCLADIAWAISQTGLNAADPGVWATWFATLQGGVDIEDIREEFLSLMPVPSVVDVDFRADRAANVRAILNNSVADAFEVQGDDLAGFALVTWDPRGGAQSAYFTSEGPVSDSLMPVYVADVLSRHVTVAVAERTESRPIGA